MTPHVWNLRSQRGFACVARALAAERSRGELRIVHYSVQGNHLHLIVETADRETLARRMQGFGVRLARAINAMMRRRRGRVLGDRYHARVLATPREAHRAIRYVLHNHATHTARNAAARSSAQPTAPSRKRRSHAAVTSALDLFSSAVTRAIERDGPSGGTGLVPLVAEPQSWLLERGWLRGADDRMV